MTAATVVVELDRQLSHPTYGELRRVTRHHLFADPPARVAVVSVDPGEGTERPEVAWIDHRDWAGALTREFAVPQLAGAGGSGRALPGDVSLPYELLIGEARARREGRTAVVDRLVTRYAAQVRDPHGSSYSPDLVRVLLDRLHDSERGTLHATVARRGPGGTRTCGLASWLLCDGWRALDPVLSADGEPGVRIHAVDPAAMVATVASGMLGCRAGSSEAAA